MSVQAAFFRVRFTVKAGLGEALKIWEMNPGCIPIIDMKKSAGDQPLDEIARRLLCGQLGRVTWVHSEGEVDEANGKFRIIDRETLLDFLNDPVTHSVYFNEYILPVARETTVQEILAWLDNLASFDQGLYDDTRWLAKVMCGLESAPESDGVVDTSDEEVIKANKMVTYLSFQLFLI